jgi:hypothetical protein
LNHLIQDPALLAPAAHFAFGFDSHLDSIRSKFKCSRFKVGLSDAKTETILL